LYIAIKNILGNVLLFLPLGLIGPVINIKFERSKNLFILAVLFSCLIEFLQLLEMYFGIANRTADIDDLILNFIGCIAGFGLFKILKTRNFFNIIIEKLRNTTFI